MNKIIDSHAHYNSIKFNKDRTRLLTDLYRNKNVEYIINCGTNANSNKDVINLSRMFSFCKAVIGFFPTDVAVLEKSPELLNILIHQLSDPNVVGLGEIGLDYFRKTVPAETQKYWFEKQISIANKQNKPICIHSRDAEKDTLDIIEKCSFKKNGVVHSFSYGPEAAKVLMDKGFYFGVGGMSTYKGNDIDAALKQIIPISRVLLETDCPYLTPEPCRKERNDSSYLTLVAQHLADIYGLTVDEVIKQTTLNSKFVYGL